ncbi:FitA-like ribbon-helix-helix domain-containing protein [Corynebacterium lemuris]|uniref:FitA-like ribbon-helix-helix domain-containing protein n=1 Tax=Corynebacterium lemuris TaxID=1859292 RepID=UPI003F700C54
MTIRNLDRELWRRLLLRAVAHDRTAEEETRAILTDALTNSPDAGYTTSGTWTAELRRLAGDWGGVELRIPEREVGDGVHRILALGEG